MKAQIIFSTRPASTKVPTSTLPSIPPWLLEIPVRLSAPWRCRAAMRFCGAPTPPNSANMMVTPLGMSATALSNVGYTLFFITYGPLHQINSV